MIGLCLLILVNASFGLTAPGQAQADTSSLMAQARAAVEQQGDQVWSGITQAPFGILLVDGPIERLYCHEGPAPGFEPAQTDTTIGCSQFTRDSIHAPNMLASFPAVDGIPTIVIGTPEATGKSHEEWVLTLIHEHFHQMQFAWDEYYTGTSALNLSDGDESGMWMLNYPFPYEDQKVRHAIEAMARSLSNAISVRGTDDFQQAVQTYWQLRERARATVSESDWRYFELQLWQEGVARWTEVAIAARSDRLREQAALAELRVQQELMDLQLPAKGRLAVYSIGAGEALILEGFGPLWRTRYWQTPFALGPLLQGAIESR